jgi:hypothetical protein
MNSPAAARLGAGEIYPAGSGLRTNVDYEMIGDNLLADTVTPEVRVRVRALREDLPDLLIGKGSAPPGDLEDIPADETAANFLGSGAVYNVKLDIGSSIAIDKLRKSIRSSEYFGASKGDDSAPNYQCTIADYAAWLQLITASTRASLPCCYYGGNIMDFLADYSYNPALTEGASYFPDQSYETWTAFTATAATVQRFENRVMVLRQHVSDICLALSEPQYWREMAKSCASITDGQAIIFIWHENFSSDDTRDILRRGQALRSRNYYIMGSEDPSIKLQRAMTEWNSLRLTDYGAESFPVSWLAATLVQIVELNPLYSIWRQSGGSEGLLACKSPVSMVLMIQNVWNQNHAEWQREEKRRGKDLDKQSKMKRAVARNSAEQSGSYGRKCWNCGSADHLARDCRKPQKKSGGKGGSKGGGKAGKGQKGGKGGSQKSWSSPPCRYQQCTGDRKTHATVDCPDKEADDKRSRAGNVQPVKGAKRKVTISGSRAAPSAKRKSNPPSSPGRGAKIGRIDSFDESSDSDT